MELLSLAATQTEHQSPIQHQYPRYPSHQRSPSVPEHHNPPVYHHHRTSSLQHLNSTDVAMDVMSPSSGPRVNSASSSPAQPQQMTPKTVTFELFFPENPNYRARLPMRVSIFPHDATDSIVTTVKNFYGLYAGPMSISFEDEENNTLIARYENFRNNMTVYVRVIEDVQVPYSFRAPPVGAQSYYSPDGYSQTPQQPNHSGANGPTRPAQNTERIRSPSPSRGRRSASASTNSKKGRSRSSRTRGSGNADEHGYSSGDGNSISGRSRDQIGNTEISVDNIVEGNRRKRAKFESSELPLFAPPQMPASTSNPSVSPARRVEHQPRPPLPFVPHGSNPFANAPPMQSPQSYTNGFAQPSMFTTPIDRRSRGSIGYSTGTGGILPTPDPTVHSCMSEEDKDVALQLMRLGDVSNVSHGRTSTSTLDEAFSGRADAASSTGATSDADSEGEDELPAPRRQKLDAAGTSRKVFHPTEAHFVAPKNQNPVSDNEVEQDGGISNGGMFKQSKAPSKPKTTKPRSQSVSKPKTAKPKAGRPAGAAKSKKTNPAVSTVPSIAGHATVAPVATSTVPATILANAPKKQAAPSVGNTALQPGEEETIDLSTKPRCQRCRKSKKGCDRQRPCGRCRDAGLGADQCISEDEGNGRKGRYGRHMGVPIKKDEVVGHQPALLPAAPIQAAPLSTTAIPPPAIPSDKAKKRKR